MKALFITPHFTGHRLSMETIHQHFITQFPEYQAVLEVVDHRANQSTCPMEFVPIRARQSYIDILGRYNLDQLQVVYYDFFSIEGLAIARLRGIPAICSIPCVLSENYAKTDSEYYRQALKRYGHLIPSEWKLGTPYLASDGWLFLGDYQLIWSYLALYPPSAFNLSFHFIGSRAGSMNESFNRNMNEIPYVYVSFGTVAPFLEGISDLIQHLVQGLFQSDSTRERFNWIIHDPTGNLKKLEPLETLEHLEINKNRITFLTECDQVALLRGATFFVTHGGGNSFHEALMTQCPMMVFPMFGDQFITARKVNELDLGISPLVEGRVEGRVEGDFENPSDAGASQSDFDHQTTYSLDSRYVPIIQNLDQWLTKMWQFVGGEDKASSKRLNVNLTGIVPIEEVCRLGLPPRPLDMFRRGDLLYGTTGDRQTFAPQFHIGERSSDTGKYIYYDQLGLPEPVTIDQIHDLIRDFGLRSEDEFPVIDGEPTFLHDSRFIDYASRYTYTNPDTREIIAWCQEGLKWLLTRDQTSRIHFVFRDYDPTQNPGTRSELCYLMNLGSGYEHRVYFWGYLNEQWKRLPWVNIWTDHIHQIVIKREHARSRFLALDQSIRERISRSPTICSTAIVQSRLKSVQSCYERLNFTSTGIDDLADLIGYRVIYPWIQPELITLIRPLLCNPREEWTQDNHVVYLMGKYLGEHVEIQFWTTIYYHGFAYDHDRVYKPLMPVSPEELLRSRQLQQTQLHIQTILDRFNYEFK